MSSLPAPTKGYKSVQLQAGELLGEHGEFLMHLFRRFLPEQDALDVFQDFCLKIIIHGFPDDIEDTRGYLYRTAKNAIIDHQRKAKTYRKKVQEYSQQSKPKPSNDPAKQVMLSNLLMKAFERIEQNLSPAVNQVFVRKYQQNLDHQEIAKIMKIEKGTVDRYLSVGTKQIRELYSQFFGDADE